MLNISIIDYGINNTRSVFNALKKLNVKTYVTSDIKLINQSDGIILPGVGAFGEAMKNLEELNLIEPLRELTKVKKTPFLGICLGMQLMADTSEEKGKFKGLSLIEGDVIKIEKHKNLIVPHMGWNNIEVKQKSNLFASIQNNSAFYFVHSYQYICKKKYILAEVDYGSTIVAAVADENIYGVQFHPERSHSKGIQMIRNFLKLI